MHNNLTFTYKNLLIQNSNYRQHKKQHRLNTDFYKLMQMQRDSILFGLKINKIGT